MEYFIRILDIVAWPVTVIMVTWVLATTLRDAIRRSEGEPTVPTSLPPNPNGENHFSSEQQRAWDYYKHADNLMHQRHAIFIVVQSIFFTAYATAAVNGMPDKRLQYTVAIGGIIVSICWSWLSERLYEGMAALTHQYLEKDAIYNTYLKSLPVWKWADARSVLHYYIPALTIIAWSVLLLRSPGFLLLTVPVVVSLILLLRRAAKNPLYSKADV